MVPHGETKVGQWCMKSKKHATFFFLIFSWEKTLRESEHHAVRSKKKILQNRPQPTLSNVSSVSFKFKIWNVQKQISKRVIFVNVKYRRVIEVFNRQSKTVVREWQQWLLLRCRETLFMGLVAYTVTGVAQNTLHAQLLNAAPAGGSSQIFSSTPTITHTGASRRERGFKQVNKHNSKSTSIQSIWLRKTMITSSWISHQLGLGYN